MERHFADLEAAGRSLAIELEPYRDDRDAVVLGIAGGGVRAAIEVARAVDLSLDLVLLKALVRRGSGELLRAARGAPRPLGAKP